MDKTLESGWLVSQFGQEVTVKNSILISVVAVTLCTAACNSGTTAQSNVVAVSAAAPAEPASRPEAVSSEEFFTTSGPIVVENQIDVDAQREGIVSSLLVDTGTYVQKGQLLAQLDDRQLAADRDAAAAKMRSIEADVKNWEAEQKVAETDLLRSEEMMKANLITQQQLEHDRYKLVASKYEFQREHENLAQQQATVRSLGLELEKTRITAPFGGIVARRYIKQGERVTAGERMFWVSATSPLRVKFTLPERFLGVVKKGDRLPFGPSAKLDQAQSATVVQVSPIVDPGSGTIEVLAELPKSQAAMQPGMTAFVRVKNPK
jgi:membrane fusion protein, multidrug efflux system